MSASTLTLLGAGDIILGMPQPEKQFELVAPVLKSADVVVGQGEMPFTSRPVVTATKSAVADPDGRARGCDPKNMKAFVTAGFNVIHLAGNHIWDSGIPGIEDTVKGLRDLGLAVVGAGMDIDEARKPAIIERKGTRFGFLSYNCTGPRETWASPVKPGCAYVKIITAYELDHPTPGGPPAVYTFAEPISLKEMTDDIQKLRLLCDVLIVHFHKGMGFVPIKLALYDQQVSYAAIDAGADLILAEHAHILKGIEQYKGKTIFHGLGNFVVGAPPSAQASVEERSPWLAQQRDRRLKEWFGVDTQGGRWHPEAKFTMIAKCTIDGGKISRTSYLPCIINNLEQPEVVKRDRGQQVFDYVDKITRAAELNGRFEWEGDEVLIRS
jgi:hypothetical protein